MHKADSLCCSPETITTFLMAIPQHKIKIEKKKTKQNTCHGPNLLMDILIGPNFKDFWRGPNILWMFWKRWSVLWDIIKLVSLSSSYLGINATFLSVLLCTVHSFPLLFQDKSITSIQKKFIMCHVINREVPLFLKLN